MKRTGKSYENEIGYFYSEDEARLVAKENNATYYKTAIVENGKTIGGMTKGGKLVEVYIVIKK